MLRKMEDKGVVAHREQGRTFVYRAAVRSEQVEKRMVGDLVTQLAASTGENIKISRIARFQLGEAA